MSARRGTARQCQPERRAGGGFRLVGQIAAEFLGQTLAKRQAESRARGKLRGIGFANAIERAASPSQPEYAEIRFNPSGTAMVLVGTKSQGQGHETLYKQILNERLGLDPKDVKFIDGDTDRVAFGMGTNGSRSTVIGGGAAWTAAGPTMSATGYN